MISLKMSMMKKNMMRRKIKIIEVMMLMMYLLMMIKINSYDLIKKAKTFLIVRFKRLYLKLAQEEEKVEEETGELAL